VPSSTDGTLTLIDLQSASFSAGGLLIDTTTDLFTIPTDGVYWVSGTMLWSETDGNGNPLNRPGFRVLAVVGDMSGAVGIDVRQPGTRVTTETASGLVHLHAGEHVALAALQDSGSDLNTGCVTFCASLSVNWVGP
jgi:hypothetical protein